MSSNDLANVSMLDLFRLEAEEQTRVLTDTLVALEGRAATTSDFERCMRAAHSLKGAARIVGLPGGVALAHEMESCFVAAQQGRLRLQQTSVDELLRGVDLLRRISQTPESKLQSWDPENEDLAGSVAALNRLQQEPHLSGSAQHAPPEEDLPQRERSPVEAAPVRVVALPSGSDQSPAPTLPWAGGPASAPEGDRVLRVTAENFNRLLGLAGESLVVSRRLRPFAGSLLRLKREQQQIIKGLHELRDALDHDTMSEPARMALASLQSRATQTARGVQERLEELESFDRRVSNLTRRMYDSAVACRMRPFADGTHQLPRMVRDLGRALGKNVKCEIAGLQTQVDRDVLEKLEAPIGHLLRNAIDHGIETPEQRRQAGKPEIGVVRLDARHEAGRLIVVVSDDGAGIDVRKLRAALVSRGLASESTAERLGDSELFAFLLLPGFSLAAAVTDISGRGVGLDAVQDVLKQMRGTMRIASTEGSGTQFQMQLPLTLSIVRCLIFELGGEAYALPLAQVVRTVILPKTQTGSIEGKPHFGLEGRRVGLVSLRQLLQVPDRGGGDRVEWPVILLGSGGDVYGLTVDRLLGQSELVVRRLDARLGKVKDVSAAAVLEDGSPVLILDSEDLLRSAETLLGSGSSPQLTRGGADAAPVRRKRVLVVEDSLTVRELERKLLLSGGYAVEVAVDGMDGWNAIRAGSFDLVMTDVDMPRMDGIELVTRIKADERLKSIPVMIVSYKERPEDRSRGLEAGADYYLAKGQFHDQKLLGAVADLIGEATV